MKTSYSRHELYALGEPLGESVTRRVAGRVIYGGGGGGGPTQTTSTVTNSNVPEYAKPYVETMLGATQNQLFTGPNGGPLTKNAEGNYEIGGFQPYKAYGGTYDPTTGAQTGYDPSKGIAGFQPMQAAAQKGIQNMQMPGQYDTAANTTQEAMNRAMGMQYKPADANYLSASAPKLQDYQMGDVRDVSLKDQTGPTMDAAQTAYAPKLETFKMDAPTDVTTNAVKAGDINAAQMGPAQQVSSQGITAANIDAAQMGPAERVGTQSFTQPGSADQYMSPYMQNVVDIQKREATRQSGILGTQQQAQAAQAGAFGGGRDAIMRAERERNLNQQMGDIQAQGSQNAFQQAQQQFNAEQQARLAAQQSNQQAGLTTGMQNLNAQQQANVQNAANQMQAQGMNSQQALQAALANQQAGLTVGSQNLNTQQQANVQNAANQLQASGMNSQQALQAALANQQSKLTAGSQNLASQIGTQQLGAGQIGLQTSLANLSNSQQAAVQNQAAKLQAMGMNSQQALQSALSNQQRDISVGGQNLNAKLGIQQLGSGQSMQAQLANQQALAQQQQLQANQQQFGANYGLQGIQAGMAGANQLANIGGQKLQAQQGIYGLQNQYGTQQQQLEQQKLNQAQQDYANAQQYPLMQLGTMSNMLRGLPMQASTSQMYQAQPNALTQGIGAAGSMASLYNAYNAKPGGAAGGLPNEFRYAKGGITSIPRYDVGGQVMSQLQQMDDQSLARQAKESSSPEIKRMAQAILKQRQAGMNMENAPQPQQDMGMAGGGIIAFAVGDKVSEEEAARAKAQTDMYVQAAQQAAAERASPLSPAAAATPTPIAAPPAAAPKPAPPPVAAPKPAPRAAAPTDKSIMAAAAKFPAQSGVPGGMAQQNPAPTAGIDTAPPVNAGAVSSTAMTAPEVDPFTAARDALAKAQTEAGKTTEDIYKSDLAAKKALGLDQNEAQQEYMKKVMAQKSNIAEDAEQRKYLRLAEFFASWGSTPGDTLVAGMSALKAKIPDMINDVKERRKAEADADKVIYELGQAKRQEDLGNWDKAESKKNKAAELAAKLQENLTTATASYEGHKITSAATVKAAEIGERSHRYSSDSSKESSKYTADSSKEASKYTADAHTRMAELRERSAALDRSANRATADENKKFGQYQAASEQERRTLERIATEENGDQYKADIRTAAMKDENGKVPAGWESKVAEAQGRIDARRDEWNARITTAKKNTDLAYSRVKVTEPAAGGDTSPSVTTMTRADVEATAKASGKSIAQVEAAAVAKGIKIK